MSKKEQKIQQSTRSCLSLSQTFTLLLGSDRGETTGEKDKEDEQKAQEFGGTHLWASAIVSVSLPKKQIATTFLEQ